MRAMALTLEEKILNHGDSEGTEKCRKKKEEEEEGRIRRFMISSFSVLQTFQIFASCEDFT